jgi:hypothetical protein
MNRRPRFGTAGDAPAVQNLGAHLRGEALSGTNSGFQVHAISRRRRRAGNCFYFARKASSSR